MEKIHSLNCFNDRTEMTKTEKKETQSRGGIPRIKHRGVYPNEKNKKSYAKLTRKVFNAFRNWRDEVSGEAAKINFSQPKKLRLARDHRESFDGDGDYEIFAFLVVAR